jgi:hypothetical protein
MSTRPGVFFGGDAAFGPANIIWAVEQGHQAAISIHNFCQGLPVTERPPQGMTLASTKMGLHEWAYSNNYATAPRQKMQHVELPVRFKNMTTEVELGFTPEQTAAEVQRCQLRQDALHRFALHRVRCLHRHLSDRLPHHHQERRRARPARPAHRAGHRAESGPVRPGGLKQTGRVMVKDENVCPHCGLCAAPPHLRVGHACCVEIP